MAKLPAFGKRVVQTTAGEVLLRAIRRSDAGDLNRIFCTPEVNRNLAFPPSNLQMTIETITTEKTSGNKSIVAAIGSRIVGRLVFRPKTGRNSHVCSFGVMFDPGVHGKGVAAATMQAAFDHLKASGFEIIRGDVHADNARARAFYRKMGFSEAGTVARTTKYEDGSYVDEVIIVKNL